METKVVPLGQKVKIRTRTREWEGHILESHDSEIILLKLKSGYNVGIREGEILNVEEIKEVKPKIEEKEEQSNEKLPNVAVIITGGTISSRLDPKTGGVISTDKKAILNIAPELKKICNPVVVSPFMKWSEDMSYRDWEAMAEVCEKYLNDDKISGIIITHGTDFLHYTAIALSFFIQNLNKPIALTYSQRSVDRASTDASLNLICAAKYAISDIAEVVLIGHKNTNDEVCLAMPATKVRKMHTSRRDAFRIINSEPIAEITREEIIPIKDFNVRLMNKAKVDTKFCEKIALVKIYPGQNPDILEYYEKEGYRGIVLEITGIGQVPAKNSVANWLPKVKKAVDNGMTICATAQTIYGRLNPNVYSAGRDLQKTGIIFLEDMLSETAFVKLGFVLGHKSWNAKEKMLENISNEYSPTIKE